MSGYRSDIRLRVTPSRRLAVCLALFLGAAMPVSAVILFEEDFSDTSEWFPVYNQEGGSATVTTDGNFGSFFVASANNVVAFAPVFPIAVASVLNPASAYALSFAVSEVSYSTSYSIEIDQFDSGYNYITTTFNVLPEGTFTGTNTVPINISWNPATEYILPKITMRTGDGNQTIKFDYLDIIPLPEPSSLFMVGLGVYLMSRRRRVDAKSAAGQGAGA